MLGNRLSHRSEMFAVAAAEFGVDGTANVLVNHFIALWGSSSTLLPDNELKFRTQLATTVYKLPDVHKLTTSAYRASRNGSVERVTHIMSNMLAMICDKPQNDWNIHIPQIEYAYNRPVSPPTGLVPNKVHIGPPQCPSTHRLRLIIP